jgi:hypothetical protein
VLSGVTRVPATFGKHGHRAVHTCSIDPHSVPIRRSRRVSIRTIVNLKVLNEVSCNLQGYLFDRRNIGRDQQLEYGMIPNGLTMCVNRLGRHPRKITDEDARPIRRREHITGARMSDKNGHEVSLVAYPAASDNDAELFNRCFYVRVI